MLSGLYPATLVLGMAPGGIAEMCITAKVLQLGVPLVTAFHVTRASSCCCSRRRRCSTRVQRRWIAGDEKRDDDGAQGA